MSHGIYIYTRCLYLYNFSLLFTVFSFTSVDLSRLQIPFGIIYCHISIPLALHICSMRLENYSIS